MLHASASSPVRTAASSLRRFADRRKKLLAAVLTATVLLTVTPAAFAAENPTLALGQYSDVIFMTGKNFPKNAPVDISATLGDKSATGRLSTSSSGAFFGGFRLPANATGNLTVKATSGSTSATANRNLGGSAAQSPATTTTSTTAKPTTTTTSSTTTAPRATTTTTAAPRPTTTTTAAPAPTTPAPSGNFAPLASSGGAWNLKFNDEFEGNAIDRAKFPVCHYATRPGCAGQNKEELQVYRPENVTVSGGSAHLTAKRQTTSVPELGTTLNYTSGSIATGAWDGKPSTMAFTYGYVEARIKMAPGKGVWSSLWMERADLVWPPEIDIVEAPNFKSTEAYNNIHYGTTANHGQQNGTFTGADFTAGYHTFGLEWTANSLKWYLDGRLIRTFSDGSKIPQAAMYVVANVSVGGWAGTPPSTTAFPSSMDIDYIRIWQR